MLYDCGGVICRASTHASFQNEGLFEQKKLSFDAPTGWWFDKLCLGRLTEFDALDRSIRCSVAQDEIRKRLGSSYETAQLKR